MSVEDVSAEEVAAAVEQLLPEDAPVQPVAAFHKGHRHLSWVLSSGNARFIGKVARYPVDAETMQQLTEQQRLHACGAAVPRLRAFDTSRKLGGRLVVVVDYLPGWDAEEALPNLTNDRALEAIEDAGRAVAQLHQIPANAFGVPGTTTGVSNWGDYVSAQTEILERAYQHTGGVDELIRAGLDLVRRLSEDVSPAVWPCVAHLDVYLPNLLLDELGRFRALLDLEHVRWVDPAMDFVKPRMWIFDELPHLAEPFLAGYGSVAGRPPRWEQRLSVATGLELLTGVEYWTRARAAGMRADYLQRLKNWVREVGT
ncbi:phosphotransferase family protein [Actinopolyspora sp. H202]|uniref:phosphotransferase family protein n=1 Tax=Actinopolyspora sp. H202 TaxID=1500456 RepID=UPI003EE66F91